MTTWPPPNVNWAYSDADCAIACADCRDILPRLSSYDLCATDPPYGIDYQSNYPVATPIKSKIVGDKAFPSWMFAILQPKVALLVWCRWDILSELPKPKSLIVWDKGNHSMGDLEHEFGRRWEACAFYPGPEHSFRYRPIDLIATPRISPRRLRHPNEKPYAVMVPLIDCHPGEIVLDPFCGTGSTLMAARLMNRKSIGIEISEHYCKIAIERMKQQTMFLA